MIILFGVRSRVHRLGVFFVLCASCHNPAAQSLIRVRKFFTLFFIPIIPMGDRYVMTCTMCAASTRITREAADHYMASIQQHQAAESVTPELPTTPAGKLTVRLDPDPQIGPGEPPSIS